MWTCLPVSGAGAGAGAHVIPDFKDCCNVIELDPREATCCGREDGGWWPGQEPKACLVKAAKLTAIGAAFENLAVQSSEAGTGCFEPGTHSAAASNPVLSSSVFRLQTTDYRLPYSDPRDEPAARRFRPSRWPINYVTGFDFAFDFLSNVALSSRWRCRCRFYCVRDPQGSIHAGHITCHVLPSPPPVWGKCKGKCRYISGV